MRKRNVIFLVLMMCIFLSGCAMLDSFLGEVPPEGYTSGVAAPVVTAISTKMNAVLPWSGTVFSLIVSGLLFIRNKKQGKKVVSLYNGVESVFDEVAKVGSDSETRYTGEEIAELVKETMKANAVAYQTYREIKEELNALRQKGAV